MSEYILYITETVGYDIVPQWPIKDIKTQLFILGNLNGKRRYFRFVVLFSIFSFVKAVLFELKNFF